MKRRTLLLFAAWPVVALAGPAEEPLFRAPAPRADAVRVLLVTGGHDHDISFYSLLDGQDDLAVTVDPYPNAFSRLSGESSARWTCWCSTTCPRS